VSPETKTIDLPGIDESQSISPGRLARRRLGGGSGLEYFVYRPASAASDAPILVAIHDAERDAVRLARALASQCEEEGSVLVAPHLPDDRYPNYQRLGRDHQSKDRSPRADAAVSAIVDEVVHLLGLSSPKVHYFGYGAGGRFVMRFALAHPDRVTHVVSAMARSYTLPNPERHFPRGLKATAALRDLQFDPERFLRVPMTAIEADLDDDSAPPPKLRGVDRASAPKGQRTSRTGRNWVAAMRAAAERHGIEPCVQLHEAKGPAGFFQESGDAAGLGKLVFDALHGRLAPSVEDAPAPEPAPQAEAEEEGDDPSAIDEPVEPQRRQGRQIAVMVAAGIAFLAIATPILLWAQYRATHVIARDAAVRGHISDVGAQLDGVVLSVEVDAGDPVTKGQIVARLQDRHLKAKVQRARSQLDKATRELVVERLAIANERLRLDGMLRQVSADSAAAGAQLEVAESVAQEARRRLQLQRGLAKKGLLAQEEVRAADTAYRTATARTDAADSVHKAALAARDLGEVESEGLAVREERLSVLEAEISALEAELAVATADLEGAIIRAPGDGAVVRRIVEPGGATVVGQPIISLWIGEELWVEAWIDEDELANLEVGGEATVTLNSYPDREFLGYVETIGVSTDYELPDEEVLQPRQDRMRDAPVLAVRIKLVDVEETLFPGLSAVVGIRKKSD